MIILSYFLLAVLVVVCALILLLVLMQRPKSEGLGTAFGSGMTGDIFGAQATNVLQKATRWLGGTFFVVALLLSMITSKTARLGNTGSTAFQSQLAALPQPKTKVVDIPITKNLTPEELRALIQKKTQEAGLPGVTGTTGTNAAPASNGLDVSIPASQTAPIPQTETSAAPAQNPNH